MPAKRKAVVLDGIEHLQCSSCKEIKPTTDFFKKGSYKDGSTQYKSECILCHNKKTLDFYHSNRKPNGIARQAAYRYTLKTIYGLSQKDFEDLLEKQDNCCPICGVPLRNPFKTVEGSSQHVDHCHESGKVRAILCLNCNLGLGSFKDNQTSLKRAIEYLQKYENS